MAVAPVLCMQKQVVSVSANRIYIRLVHLGLVPSDGLLGSSALLARAALLGGVSALPMRCMRGVFRVGLLGSRFPLCRMLRFGLSCRMLFMSSLTHGCRGVRFVMALRGLLFLFFLLRRFLNAGELAQNFFALFLSLAAAGQLHGGNLLANGLTLWPP